MTTDYTIEKDKLLIRSGIIYRKTIDIQSIHRIVETFNPLSSPALSLDRLKIHSIQVEGDWLIVDVDGNLSVE